MPSLVVYVDQDRVTVELEEGDDLTTVACLLEGMGYAVSPAFPQVMVEGNIVADTYETVDYCKTYKFGK